MRGLRYIGITHSATNDLSHSLAATAFDRPGFAAPARAFFTHKVTNDNILFSFSGQFSSFSLGKIQGFSKTEENLCNIFINNRLRSICENYPPTHDWFPPYADYAVLRPEDPDKRSVQTWPFPTVIHVYMKDKTPYYAEFNKGDIQNCVYWPAREVDLAATQLEFLLSKDIWLDGLEPEDAAKVKEATGRMKSTFGTYASENDKYTALFTPDECRQLLPIFEKLDAVRLEQASGEGFGHFFGPLLYRCTACMHPRDIRELVMNIPYPSGIYQACINAWPLSDFEFLAVSTYEKIKTDMACTDNVRSEQARSDRKRILDYLRKERGLSVIHDWEMAEVNMDLRERFPECDNDTMVSAILHLTDSELYMKTEEEGDDDE